MTIWLGIIVILALAVVYDVLRKKHAIIHNFPLIGHLRYWLESTDRRSGNISSPCDGL